MAKIMKELTSKQQRFIAEYLIDLNTTQAAMRAGYSKKNADKIGPELLGKTRVARAIQEAMDARAQRTQIHADYVLMTIRDTIERCRQAKPVLDHAGNPTGLYTFQANSVLKGCELLGRHLGLWNDKLAISTLHEDALKQLGD